MYFDSEEPISPCNECDDGIMFIIDEIAGLVMLQCNHCGHNEIQQTEYIEIDEGE